MAGQCLGLRGHNEKENRDRSIRIIPDVDADESLMPQDDVQYVADMGLITLDKPRRIANSINMEKRKKD